MNTVHTIKCCGREFITKNEFAYEEAMLLSDGKTPAESERFKFIIRLSEDCFKETKKENKRVLKIDNTIASLHPLAKEMHKSFLSPEDEEWLDDVLGVDPYTPLY